MKILISISFVIITSITSFSQDSFEDLFRLPLEREREPGVQVYSPVGPVNTETDNPWFFNMNISQNSAPQNEPSVCISRKNPNRVVAAWRDFRYGIDPNANRRVGYSYSTNAGLTWSTSQILDSTLLPGLTRNSDPVVTVDTAGNFYINVISISPTGSNLTLAVYKSTNSGVTFPFAYVASQTGSEDKEWITTDLIPSSPYVNTLYTSWTSFSLGGIRLTKSTNGGVNWLTPVPVSSSGSVQGSNICTDRQGRVHVVWLGYGANASVRYNGSTNGGTSFGSEMTIASGTPPSGLPNGVGTFPFIAVDNGTGSRSGWLYTVFADNRNGDCDIFLTKSTNNGTNWSSPIRVNNDGLANGKIQYWPVIAVNESGTIAIMFMDTRNTANNQTIEAWLARSVDGGVTFTNELISSEPSPTNIPGSNVRFGDYIDIDYVGQNIVPVWTDERLGGNNMEIFSAEISELLGIASNNNSPDKFHLGQNYPNPFNPSTVISFSVPKQSYVTLKIYDQLGREIKTLIDDELGAGNFSATFSADNYSSGVYFYTLASDDFRETKKMLLIK